MAPKLAADDNLAFLYLCYQHAGAPPIDFTGLGSALNLKPGAARMRFYRLRDKIEPTLGAAGAPVAKTTTKRNTKVVPKKRPSIKQEKVKAVEEPPAKRQTRGKRIDFSSALDSDSEDSRLGEDDSEDAYDSSDEQMEGGSDDLSLVDSCAVAGDEGKLKEYSYCETPKSASDCKKTPVGSGSKTTTLEAIPEWPNTSQADSAQSRVKMSPSPPAVQLTPPATEKSRKSMFNLQDAGRRSDDSIKAELNKYDPGKFIPITPDAFFPRSNTQSDHLDTKRLESTAASSTTLYSRANASSYVTAAEYNDDDDDDDEEDSGVDDTSIGPEDSVSGTGKYHQIDEEEETPGKPVTWYFGRLWGR